MVFILFDFVSFYLGQVYCLWVSMRRCVREHSACYYSKYWRGDSGQQRTRAIREKINS